MKATFLRLRPFYFRSSHLLFQLLMTKLLLESLLCDATALEATAGNSTELGARDGEQQSIAIRFDEETSNSGGDRVRRSGVNRFASESLSEKSDPEDQQTLKGKRKSNVMNVKRKRNWRGVEPAVTREKHTQHEYDREADHELDQHDKNTSHEKHHDDHSHSWKYYGVYGPSNWSLVAPDCSSDRPRQTPIDIQTTLTELDETMSDIRLAVNDPQPDEKVTMVNNGHTVNLVFNTAMRVSGGKLGAVFRVAGVHFHWGASDYTGSEHTIDGERFPLEMHIVSYDEERFSDLAETLSSNNSLAVLGVLFTISEKDNLAIDPIVSNLLNVQKPASSTSVPYFDLRTLLPPKYSTYFYRYFGSLTTPPCSEVVVWTVFKNRQNISRSQVARFRELYEAKNDDDDDYTYLRHNWRPLQQIHGRTVARSFLNVPRRRPPVAPTTTANRKTSDAPPLVAVAVEQPATGSNRRPYSSSDGLHSLPSIITILIISLTLSTLLD